MAHKTRPANRQEVEKILLLPDTHVPFHDKKAFALALEVARQFKPDIVVILGDFADFYSMSFHDKSPERRLRLVDEAEAVKEALDELGKACRSAYRRIYIAGNHEDRFTRYITRKAREFHGLTSIRRLFELEEKGWEYVPYRDFAKVGNLILTHDTGGHGLNAHRKAHKDTGLPVVIGHTHRLAVEYAQNAIGTFVTSAMLGWLGDPESVDYAHKARVKAWVHGVGLGHKLRDNTVLLTPLPFYKGQCVLNNKLLRWDDADKRRKAEKRRRSARKRRR